MNCPKCGVAIAVSQTIADPNERTSFMGWTWQTPPKFTGDMVAYGKLPTPQAFDVALKRTRLCVWEADGYKWLHFAVDMPMRSGAKRSHRLAKWRV